MPSTTTLSTITLAAVLTAGMFGYARADSPDNVGPPSPTKKKKLPKQHFCCSETYSKDGKLYGTDCDFIGQSDVKVCVLSGGAVLYCPGAYARDTGGTTTCG